MIRVSRMGYLTVSAVVAATPLVGVLSSPASAIANACNYGWSLTTTQSAERSFNASIGCDGFWVVRTGRDTITVAGQYLKGGRWMPSSLTAKTIGRATNFQQIIGDTVDGRTMRGIATKADANGTNVQFGY